jgi:hypothetical protein
MLMVESGIPLVNSAIEDDQIVSQKDQVERAIADFFQ